VKHAAQAISARAADAIVRADLLTTLCIFGKLAYPDIDMLRLIGREQMKESKFFEDVLAEGRKEGRLEGRIEGQRNAILDALDVKFGPAVKAELAPLLAEIADSERLAQLHRLAVKCRRIDEFRRLLT
jgi:predicted transposase YdaD